MNWAELKYRQLYEQLNFERKGLFELVRKEFGNLRAIYPGSSIHITPSFFFSDVTYVDNSAIASSFFENLEAIRELIENRKSYKNRFRIQFMAQDFRTVSVPEASYDLLISLNAGQLIQHCAKCIKRGGLILTSDTFSGLEYCLENNFALTRTIGVKNGDKYFFMKTPTRSGQKSMVGKESGLKFRDAATYYVFRT